MVANGSARPALIAICVGVALGGSLSAALALSAGMPGKSVEAVPAAVASPLPAVEKQAVRVEPGCHPMCSSMVIAASRPGEPALVVDGASAFGMALDAGAARVAPRFDVPTPLVPAVEIPAPAETFVSAQAAVSIGASAAFSGHVAANPAQKGPSGGWALADASGVMPRPFE